MGSILVMSKRKRIKKQDIKYYIIAFAIVLIISFFFEEEDNPVQHSEKNPYSQEDSMEVHFLDVEQGLSIVVQFGEEVLVYDGGDRDTSSFVVSYIEDLGITEIDYMISSHYDSDHLAGLIGCLNAFEVKNVIGSNYEHNSKLYTSFMDAVKDEGVKMQYPEAGTKYAFGDAEITILPPAEIGNDSNANSVVIKLSYGESDFIFTGDADYGSEREMVASGIKLDCEVLSLAHHGSSSGNSSLF